MFPTSFTLRASVPTSSDPASATDLVLESIDEFLHPYSIREIQHQPTHVEYEVGWMRYTFRQMFTPWLARCVIEVRPADGMINVVYSAQMLKTLLVIAGLVIVIFGGVLELAIPVPFFDKLGLIVLICLISWLWIYGLGYYLQSYIYAHFFMRRLKKWAIELIAQNEGYG